MNDQNLQYLKDNLKYLGFGEKLYPELEKNMAQGFPEFQIRLHTEYHKDKISATLDFRKSESSDVYFFNRYNATLEKFNGEKLEHTFYINKGNGVTTKEAYNLLCGRAVLKELMNIEGKRYNAWIQLDLRNKDDNGHFKVKQFHEGYGFDLEETLRQFPIKELEEAGSSKMLLRSLEKGNLQAVIFEKDGKTSRMFLEAIPQYKTVRVYDGQMKPVQKELLEEFKTNQQLSDKTWLAGIKEESKENDRTEKKDVNESKKNAKSAKQGNETSLLLKRRSSVDRGLSLT